MKAPIIKIIIKIIIEKIWVIQMNDEICKVDEFTTIAIFYPLQFLHHITLIFTNYHNYNIWAKGQSPRT